jgi:hypothetical protein
MPCYSPLMGWRAKERNPSGKRSIVFRRSEGYDDQQINVPCGQCVGCRLEHSRKWAVRCMHEADMHENNCFITLTYQNDKLPKNGTLVKEHFQKFMKRLRKKYGKGIRYYACGEYGEKYSRPHYHACIFGLDFQDKVLFSMENGIPLFISQELQDLWTDPEDGKPYGFCTIGEVNFETAAYVARYCMKKRKGKNWEEHYELYCDLETGEIVSREPEFPLMSRRPGIGRPWMDKFGKEVYPSDEVIVNSRPCKPPRYYDNVCEQENPEIMDDVKLKRRIQQKKQWFDNTLRRLYTRGIVATKQTNDLRRRYENES